MKIYVVWNDEEHMEDGIRGVTIIQNVAIELAGKNINRIDCFDSDTCQQIFMDSIGDYELVPNSRFWRLKNATK